MNGSEGICRLARVAVFCVQCAFLHFGIVVTQRFGRRNGSPAAEPVFVQQPDEARNSSAVGLVAGVVLLGAIAVAWLVWQDRAPPARPVSVSVKVAASPPDASAKSDPPAPVPMGLVADKPDYNIVRMCDDQWPGRAMRDHCINENERARAKADGQWIPEAVGTKCAEHWPRSWTMYMACVEKIVNRPPALYDEEDHTGEIKKRK